jgi:hypothetical protein
LFEAESLDGFHLGERGGVTRNQLSTLRARVHNKRQLSYTLFLTVYTLARVSRIFYISISSILEDEYKGIPHDIVSDGIGLSTILK